MMGKLANWRVVFLVLLIAPVGLAVAQPTLNSELYRSWLREGLKREAAGKWAPAAECFREALRYNPRGREARLELARCTAQLGRRSEAIKILRSLLADAPNMPPASVLLARLLRDAGDNNAALAVVQSAIALAPNDPDLLTEAGAVFLSMDKPGRALRYLEKAAKIRRPDYRLHLLMARCYAALKRPVDAERHYLAAMALRPGDLAAMRELAELYLAAGRWLDAMALGRKMAAQHPDDWRAWRLVGDAALALADATAAGAAYAKAIAAAPADQRRALALSVAKAATEADMPEVVEQVLSSPAVPQDPELAAYRARALEQLGQNAAAAQTWESWAGQRPEFLAEAARCWLKTGDSRRALASLMRLGRQRPEAFQEAARLAVSIGDQATAQQAIRQMLALRPFDAKLHLALAELLVAQGRLAEGLRQAAQARRQRPAEAWRVMVKIYRMAGLPAAAARAALRAWSASGKIQDCEMAAGLLCDAGLWRDLRRLLADAPRLTNPLRLAAARLALHDGLPGAALKALGRRPMAGSAAVWCQAMLALGRPAEAVRHALAAGPGEIDDRQLAAVLAAARDDAQARKLSLAALESRAAAGALTAPLAEALARLLARQVGGEEALRKLAELAEQHPQCVELVRLASRLSAEATGAGAAVRVARLAAASAHGHPKSQAACLSIAAAWSVTAGRLPEAADFLSQAAALKGLSRVVAVLTELKHRGRATSRGAAALAALAGLWSGDDRWRLFSEGQIILGLMRACASEGEAEAWAQGRAGSPDGELVAAEQALAQGDALAAVARLTRARPSRAAIFLRARALLAAGRPAEAAVAIRPLLALPCAEVHQLAGDAAAACGDATEAAWHYACAAVLAQQSAKDYVANALFAIIGPTAVLSPRSAMDQAKRAASKLGPPAGQQLLQMARMHVNALTAGRPARL